MKQLITCLYCFFTAGLLFAQEEGNIPAGETTIHYRSFGKGQPLLIINGGPGLNSDGFVELAKKLSPDNRTIIYDQRGTGRSTLKSLDNTTITMSAMAHDLETLRNYLHIDSWIILGHSFGGMLASYYCTVYPEHIRGIILSSSGGVDLDLLSYASRNINAHLSAMERDSVSYWTNKISNGDSSYFARSQRARFLAPAYVYDKKNAAVIAERLTWSNQTINGLVWQDMRKINFDCTKKLATFNKPVLIIQGKQDIVELRTAEKSHAAFKNSTVVLMDHCVHYGWLDRPDIYFSAVKEFLLRLKV